MATYSDNPQSDPQFAALENFQVLLRSGKLLVLPAYAEDVADAAVVRHQSTPADRWYLRTIAVVIIAIAITGLRLPSLTTLPTRALDVLTRSR